MKTYFKTFSTFPSKKDDFWQVVVIPTISFLVSKEESYSVVSFEWLFWSATICFKK
jgi:hypothetical protein